MRPKDFWNMHPQEFYWMAEGHKEKHEVQSRAGKKMTLTHAEALRMKENLMRKRAKAGFPAKRGK